MWLAVTVSESDSESECVCLSRRTRSVIRWLNQRVTESVSEYNYKRDWFSQSVDQSAGESWSVSPGWFTDWHWPGLDLGVSPSASLSVSLCLTWWYDSRVIWRTELNISHLFHLCSSAMVLLSLQEPFPNYAGFEISRFLILTFGFSSSQPSSCTVRQLTNRRYCNKLFPVNHASRPLFSLHCRVLMGDLAFRHMAGGGAPKSQVTMQALIEICLVGSNSDNQ